jgi:cell division protein FtsZ
MIHFDLPKEKSSIIKVIGVGGGGSNAVNHMFSQNIEGVNFIICNTDAQAIALSGVPNKIQLGPHLTQGLGAGANPEIGKQATEESLEEIKRILEVNTKMAFITAGMGGGTGTGGAPIISKICKELGILTVGIVTTPFSYEGRKRQIQAEEGIQRLKGYVDTLLVISNDKLRHQYGNLKMKEAFAKADNVLATAAKCITDVISSTGQINVDFADVCTVMKNGGVAILGNAAASGENRAQQAIEEALNSPLLNDNDIRGARWILININSAEGQHEFTMDEVDTIQTYLLSRAGEESDVILGLGYDNSLGDQIGITLIATGFEYKDPFAKAEEKKLMQAKDQKIVMTLKPELSVQEIALPEKHESVVYFTDEEDRNNTVDNLSTTTNASALDSPIEFILPPEEIIALKIVENNSPVSAASGGYLAKPSNIYAEPVNRPAVIPRPEYDSPVHEPIAQQLPAMPQQEEEPSFDMQLVIKDDSNAADQPLAPSTQPSFSDQHRTSHAEDLAMPDVAEEQKRKAAERIQKLRNLSFNINAADPNNEFDTVPAYIRRNLELYNTVSPAENFYSNYTVKTDEHNHTQISTINTFLDGKKPD